MRPGTVLASAAALLIAGCGGSNGDDAAKPGEPSSASLRRQLDEATRSTVADFPPVGGRTLQQVADGLGAAGPTAALATSVFVPGTNRLAFGVIDQKTGFVYGKTAVYVARGPDDRARGPYPAPADLLITDPPFRSRTAASEDDPFSAVYSASVPFDRPGRHAVLAVTSVQGRLVGAPARVRVVARSRDRVAGVGAPAPRVATDTVASAGGDVESIDTRIPPDDMHETSFQGVVWKNPLPLLFATPRLCQWRVCGPVVDIAPQLKTKYGERMEFIHQEVYVDNDPKKGLRPPLRRFGLSTEPWLFTIDRTGRIAARLEGSFGFRAFERAIQAALAP